MSSTNRLVECPIRSYAQLQKYMNNIINFYVTSITSAPHNAFWCILTYEQFTTGNVPGVDPPVQILKIGDGTGSNIVQALQGVGPLFGPCGQYGYGRMPADGTGPWTSEQIQPLIDWIDANCPNDA